MKILLVGEYSGLHNSLKQGLEKGGHEVVILASGDGFKNYPVDIKLEASFYRSPFGNIIRQIVYRITKNDLADYELLKKFNRLKPQLKGFDVVQLINENSFLATPKIEKNIISFLKEHNKKLFLLSCGTDYSSVSYALKKELDYSLLTPFFQNPNFRQDFASVLKYVTPAYKELHEFIMESVEGIIASDIDYHLPLKKHPKYLGMIPNPVNTDKLHFSKLNISEKVQIFLGINSTNAIKKGVPIFKAIAKRLQHEYPDKVTIKIVEDLPYSEYIKSFDEAHIILDQLYSYDQGYNALEAMAKGKVVCTGAEKAFYDYYGLKDQVAINATPNTQQLYEDLEKLILNPKNLITLSGNARKFIEEHHHYIKIAEQYLALYSSSSEASESSKSS